MDFMKHTMLEERYLLYAGISMLAMGICLFILIVILGGDEKKQDWYYTLATPWEKFCRRVKNSFIAFFWLASMVGEFVGAYLMRLETWGVAGRTTFLVGMAIASLAMFIRSLRILFEKYTVLQNNDAENICV